MAPEYAQRKTASPATRNASGNAAGKDVHSLADKAYDRIRDDILRGVLAMGDILSRRRLAGKLKISFLPITEALQRLEADGLVESRPRIGTRVRIPTRQDILDSYQIREALETQSARLCSAQMTAVEKKELLRSAKHLDKLYDRLYRASAAESADRDFLFSVHTCHMQFHLRIADFARSPGLSKAIQREQVLVFNWLFDAAARQKRLPAGFHQKLARALCLGKPAEADKAMRAHIQFGLSHVLRNLETIQVSKAWRHKPVRAGAGTFDTPL